MSEAWADVHVETWTDESGDTVVRVNDRDAVRAIRSDARLLAMDNPDVSPDDLVGELTEAAILKALREHAPVVFDPDEWVDLRLYTDADLPNLQIDTRVHVIDVGGDA